jgi:2-keto-4-pentenoate hydratase/2-oxohepta-3-ene-1,7-dioic acid hydratase in catechol pathway
MGRIMVWNGIEIESKGGFAVRLATVQTEKGPRACGFWNGRYVDLNAADPSLPADVRGLLALGGDGLQRAKQAQERGTVGFDPKTATLLPPVLDPQKIVCLGLNYRDHAIESGMAIPEEPVLFSKYASALVGQGADIVIPRDSTQVDYEAELVFVIGQGGRDIPRERAMDHVAGYMVGHDVSARDWQLNKPGKQWMAGKTFDTFAPTGPELVTADDVPDPHALRIQLRLNDQTMQDSNTNQLIFRIDEVVAYLSRIVTLTPGDLVFTGTPPGVVMAQKPPLWLQPGDVTEVEIEGLGVLRNTLVQR